MPDAPMPSTPDSGAKFVTLNADDYGLSEGIDRGILELVERGRLHAVSCMSLMAGWPTAARALRGLPSGVSVGLHLTLTALPAGAALTSPSTTVDPGPGGLLARALGGPLDLATIKARIVDQLARVEDAVGRPPAHVDGHQHVHAMPGIAGILSAVLLARYGAALPWLRVTAPALPAAPGAAVQRLVISGLGAHQRRLLQATPFRSNAVFGGIRSFTERISYAALLERQLIHAADEGTLIMCHPATAGRLAGDPVAAAREAEFSFLAGDGLDDALERAGCRLGPLSPLPIGPLRGR